MWWREMVIGQMDFIWGNGYCSLESSSAFGVLLSENSVGVDPFTALADRC